MTMLPRRGEQIVGRERRERVSQLAWCGEGCFDSRRRVNSTVGLTSLWMPKYANNRFEYHARFGKAKSNTLFVLYHFRSPGIRLLDCADDLVLLCRMAQG